MICKSFVVLLMLCHCVSEQCGTENDYDGSCSKQHLSGIGDATKYSKEANEEWVQYRRNVKNALEMYQPCSQFNCSCHASVLKSDLKEFRNGITHQMVKAAEVRGTKYQIINHHLYRSEACMFPARCAGVEHFILEVIHKLPDLEFILNTRDWPQVSRHHNHLQPVFSFSKTYDYYDILYPAWSFWEGGPAIKLYPRGLGRWDTHRDILKEAAEKWQWTQKMSVAFFRGSRTTEERDSLVLLSREWPEMVDASYTKNQAWRSNADTLNAPPAEEVPLKEHCRYKFLFNYRGVAASFRLKHLFLCKSVVFHVGNEWIEFFYPAMKPWVHYIPVQAGASKEEIRKLLDFVIAHDDLAKAIAEEGYRFIWNHLRMKDISCYWKKLLKRYAMLLKYHPVLDSALIEIKSTP